MEFKQKGFTLIELIIVIAIIALLAAATFVAVNPAKRIGDANNAQRWSDVTAIGDAWVTYIADNTGSTATTVTNTTYAIATTTKGHTATCGATTTTAIVDMSELVTQGYVGQVPSDPSTASSNTEYYFYLSDTGAMTFGACDTYDSAVISVIR